MGGVGVVFGSVTFRLMCKVVLGVEEIVVFSFRHVVSLLPHTLLDGNRHEAQAAPAEIALA